MSHSAKSLRVALVHDFLREYGGAERVLEALHETYPQAPVYVAFLDENALGIHWQRFKDWDIRQTWFSKIPFYTKLYSPLRFLAPRSFADLDLSKYDVVISSSNAFMAKAVQVPNGIHVCYCHTPPRALYGYSTMSSWKRNPFFKFFGTLINHYMRIVDFKLAQQVDYFIANSKEVASRIKKFYRRDSTVIYPPVKVKTALVQNKSSLELTPTVLKNHSYYIYVNRLGLQKHPELAVEVCSRLKLPLKVVGSGRMESYLKQIAGPSIEFLGSVTDEELYQLYSGAKALLYPVEDEDFGIVPVEAMAWGVPVIAYRSGGPKETVQEGKTGLFFNDLTSDSLAQAIEKFQKTKFNRRQIQHWAEQFGEDRFKQQIKKFILSVNKRS